MPGDERAGLDPAHRLTHFLLEVAERLRRPARLDASLVLGSAFELVIGESQHAAIGVVNHDDFLGAQYPWTKARRADFTSGEDPAAIANHMRLAFFDPQHPIDVEP